MTTGDSPAGPGPRATPDSVAAAGPRAAPPAGAGPGATPTAPAARSPFHRGEIAGCAFALALLLITFLLAWYGTASLPGRTASLADRSSSENAWHALSVVRWVILITCVTTLGSAVLHINQRSHGARTNTGALVTMLGLLTSALLFYRVLIDLPSPVAVVDQKVGAYLGLLSAVGIAFCGWEALRDERLRQRAAQARSRGRNPAAARPS